MVLEAVVVQETEDGAKGAEAADTSMCMRTWSAVCCRNDNCDSVPYTKKINNELGRPFQKSLVEEEAMPAARMSGA